MTKSDNTPGREANAAQPLGERKGTSSKSATDQAGKASQTKAGPDGDDSSDVSRTFKKQ